MFFKDKLKLVKLPVSRILPNPAQPRKDFDQAALENLAQSIKENGLLQPVTVRRENGGYTLIAGTAGCGPASWRGLRRFPPSSQSAPPRTAPCWPCWKTSSGRTCRCSSRPTPW